MYQSQTAAAMYSLLYGPCVFLFYVPAMSPTLHAMGTLKLALVLGNLILLGTLYALMRRYTERSVALGLLSMPVAVMLYGPGIEFGLRGDTWELLCVALGLLAAVQHRWLWSALAAGICCGLFLNFKLTTVPIALLLLAIVFRKHGKRGAVAMAAAAIGAAALPFASSRISFLNYLNALGVARHHGLVAELMAANIAVAIFLFAPGLFLWSRFGERSKHVVAGAMLPGLLLLAALVAIVTGAKNGSGPWHLWPLLPFALAWTARLVGKENETEPASWPQQMRLVTAITVAAMLVGLRFGARDYKILRTGSSGFMKTEMRTAQAELTKVEGEFSGRNVAMGYAGDMSTNQLELRYELPLVGNDFFLDQTALNEWEKAGRVLPKGLEQRILGCEDIWLIPHGLAPFSTEDMTLKNVHYIFPEEVQQGFVNNHVVLERGQEFDVWACQGH